MYKQKQGELLNLLDAEILDYSCVCRHLVNTRRSASQTLKNAVWVYIYLYSLIRPRIALEEWTSESTRPTHIRRYRTDNSADAPWIRLEVIPDGSKWSIYNVLTEIKQLRRTFRLGRAIGRVASGCSDDSCPKH